MQGCVGTQARLGHAALDAELQKVYIVTTLLGPAGTYDVVTGSTQLRQCTLHTTTTT